jgi:hypothetical protein
VRRLFGDKDHLGIPRSGLEPVLQLEKVRGIVEIEIEDAVLTELRIQTGFEWSEIDLKMARELSVKAVAVAAQISNEISDLVHHATLKSSSLLNCPNSRTGSSEQT